MKFSDREMREKGLCPHDGGACGRARRCAWSKADACGVNNEALVDKCSPVTCKRKFGACVWRCSKRDRAVARWNMRGMNGARG